MSVFKVRDMTPKTSLASVALALLLCSIAPSHVLAIETSPPAQTAPPPVIPPLATTPQPVVVVPAPTNPGLGTSPPALTAPPPVIPPLATTPQPVVVVPAPTNPGLETSPPALTAPPPVIPPLATTPQPVVVVPAPTNPGLGTSPPALTAPPPVVPPLATETTPYPTAPETTVAPTTSSPSTVAPPTPIPTEAPTTETPTPMTTAPTLATQTPEPPTPSPLPPCPPWLENRCWNGQCVSDLRNCPCAPDEVYCNTNSKCVPRTGVNASVCPCPPGLPVRCDINFCQASIEQCNAAPTCTGDKSFHCPTGYCAYDEFFCTICSMSPEGCEEGCNRFTDCRTYQGCQTRGSLFRTHLEFRKNAFSYYPEVITNGTFMLRDKMRIDMFMERKVCTEAFAYWHSPDDAFEWSVVYHDTGLPVSDVVGELSFSRDWRSRRTKQHHIEIPGGYLPSNDRSYRLVATYNPRHPQKRVSFDGKRIYETEDLPAAFSFVIHPVQMPTRVIVRTHHILPPFSNDEIFLITRIEDGEPRPDSRTSAVVWECCADRECTSRCPGKLNDVNGVEGQRLWIRYFPLPVGTFYVRATYKGKYTSDWYSLHISDEVLPAVIPPRDAFLYPMTPYTPSEMRLILSANYHVAWSIDGVAFNKTGLDVEFPASVFQAGKVIEIVAHVGYQGSSSVVSVTHKVHVVEKPRFSCSVELLGAATEALLSGEQLPEGNLIYSDQGFLLPSLRAFDSSGALYDYVPFRAQLSGHFLDESLNRGSHEIAGYTDAHGGTAFFSVFSPPLVYSEHFVVELTFVANIIVGGNRKMTDSVNCTLFSRFEENPNSSNRRQSTNLNETQFATANGSSVFKLITEQRPVSTVLQGELQSINESLARQDVDGTMASLSRVVLTLLPAAQERNETDVNATKTVGDVMNLLTTVSELAVIGSAPGETVVHTTDILSTSVSMFRNSSNITTTASLLNQSLFNGNVDWSRQSGRTADLLGELSKLGDSGKVSELGMELGAAMGKGLESGDSQTSWDPCEFSTPTCGVSPQPDYTDGQLAEDDPWTSSFINLDLTTPFAGLTSRRQSSGQRKALNGLAVGVRRYPSAMLDGDDYDRAVFGVSAVAPGVRFSCLSNFTLLNASRASAIDPTGTMTLRTVAMMPSLLPPRSLSNLTGNGSRVVVSAVVEVGVVTDERVAIPLAVRPGASPMTMEFMLLNSFSQYRSVAVKRWDSETLSWTSAGMGEPTVTAAASVTVTSMAFTGQFAVVGDPTTNPGANSVEDSQSSTANDSPSLSSSQKAGVGAGAAAAALMLVGLVVGVAVMKARGDRREELDTEDNITRTVPVVPCPMSAPSDDTEITSVNGDEEDSKC